MMKKYVCYITHYSALNNSNNTVLVNLKIQLAVSAADDNPLLYRDDNATELALNT